MALNVFLLLLSFAFANAAQPAPAIVSVARIWDSGAHNAFTDLMRWRDRWYCTFRESDAHVGGNGRIRVLVSNDGETWTSAALIGETGVDLRDPKLSITPDGRLMMVAGGSVYDGTRYMGRQPRVMFSSDGSEWSMPERILAEGDWLWRVTWHEGRAYGVTYKAVEGGSAEWTATLVSSRDGRSFDPVTTFAVPDRPNETTLRFMPDGEMVALVRREAGNRFAWIGRSRAPYTAWTWREIPHQIGGPNFIRLPEGDWWASGRSYPGGPKTVDRAPDGRWRLRAGAHAAVRRRHQLCRDGVARRRALGELLRVARGQERDLSRARESPLTPEPRYRRSS